MRACAFSSARYCYRYKKTMKAADLLSTLPFSPAAENRQAVFYLTG
jgi:hypothetical protein